ncbi:hypothetical protein F4777DRAFT_567873 [Nemania sp. FL0916]|nr:hypothetical protein F4777DRAFT_567873 [Nemania sp. FL0916]
MLQILTTRYQMDTSKDTTLPFRILSLDGGGIRGKSSLLILENIMEQVRESKGLAQVPRPCEYFDLIGGTSTGGIIAIMLGRLGMTVDKCIRTCEDLGRVAFTLKSKMPQIAPPKGAFSAEKLETAVRRVVKDNCTEPHCVTQRSQGRPTVDTCPHEDLKFRDANCTKTVILSITKENADALPTLFATYDTSTSFEDCSIWQIARATSAATTFFKSIKIGRDNIEFIDAGLKYNNPCEILIREVKHKFLGRRELQILSIGTGLGDVVTIKDKRLSILNALKNLATSSKAVAERLDYQYKHSDLYFRFNVEQGLNDVTLSDWEKTSRISAHTKNYLEENRTAILKYVDRLLSDSQRRRSDVPQPAGSSRIVPSYHIPFLRNTAFAGRERVLQILQQKLFHSQDCRTLAIVGLGGVGKTQVVLQFAYWVKQYQPEYSIFWMPAYSEESFAKALLEISQKMRIQIDITQEDPKITVRNYLSSEGSGKWLLIIHNADYPKTISGPTGIYDYLPESDNGLTVFTTRSSELAQSVAGSDQIELSKMDAQEARLLLWNSVVRKQLLQDDISTAQLLEELTYLPLAITQAAAYLNQNLQHHHSPIKRYLELLRGTEDDLVHLMSAGFHDKTRYQDGQNAVATTWLVSFDQIRTNHRDAADLLSFISCIEPKAIPRSLLPKLESDGAMESALGILSGYAFLKSSGVDETYDMHSLVHLATRIWIQQQALTKEININAFKHLSAEFPAEDLANRHMRQVFLPHAFQLLTRNESLEIEERYDLLYRVGACLRKDRRVKESVRCLKETAKWMKAHYPKDHEKRLDSQHYLAVAYSLDRQNKKAILILEKVTEIKKNTLPEQDRSRLLSESELATAYEKDGQLKKAIKMFKRVVKIYKTITGEKDPDRLAIESGLAIAYSKGGQVKKAIKLLEHVIEIQKTTLYENDNDRLEAEEELAITYLKSGQIKRAIELQEYVFEIRKRMFNEEDDTRITSESVLAGAYLMDGQAKKAVQIFEHVVALRKTTLDEKDNVRLVAEHNLATAYMTDGRTEEAIGIMEHVVEVRKITLDEKDLRRLTSERDLAKTYLGVGQAQKAVDLVEHVVMVESQLYADDDPKRQISLDLLKDARMDLKAQQAGSSG